MTFSLICSISSVLKHRNLIKLHCCCIGTISNNDFLFASKVSKCTKWTQRIENAETRSTSFGCNFNGCQSVQTRTRLSPGRQTCLVAWGKGIHCLSTLNWRRLSLWTLSLGLFWLHQTHQCIIFRPFFSVQCFIPRASQRLSRCNEPVYLSWNSSALLRWWWSGSNRKWT